MHTIRSYILRHCQLCKNANNARGYFENLSNENGDLSLVIFVVLTFSLLHMITTK